MKNIWIITTGSSDVQLTSKDDWSDWRYNIKNSIYSLPFEPTRSINEDGEPYRLASRVLGIAYAHSPEEVYSHLTFPLLENFIQVLKQDEIQLDHIVILVSDQEEIFPELERETQRCAYWQDTCQLRPALEKYLHDQFPETAIESLILKPEFSSPRKGLDDWDSVLSLVQKVFQALKFEIDPQTVYVSHQAGTPAISSAVQFTSLSRFGKRVRFLVSNEHDSDLTKVLDGSEYLKGIRKKEAQELLKYNNYLGLQNLISDDLDDEGNRNITIFFKASENRNITILLQAAVQWNCAEFEEFKTILLENADEPLKKKISEQSSNWWWIAHEEIYLAVIRRNQGNIVEAFFHSFRAFEGVFAAWGNKEFGEHIRECNGVTYLMPEILADPKGYFSEQQCKGNVTLKEFKQKLEFLQSADQKKIKSNDRIQLNFATLCKLFRAFRYKEYKNECQELKIFWETSGKGVSTKRNLIVHQIQGMSEPTLWEYWWVSSQEEWAEKLLKFLNFIAKKDLPKEFESLADASLMSKVHRELEVAIANW
jgi:hypothetical protein